MYQRAIAYPLASTPAMPCCTVLAPASSKGLLASPGQTLCLLVSSNKFTDQRPAHTPRLWTWCGWKLQNTLRNENCAHFGSLESIESLWWVQLDLNIETFHRQKTWMIGILVGLSLKLWRFFRLTDSPAVWHKPSNGRPGPRWFTGRSGWPPGESGGHRVFWRKIAQ